MMKIFTLLTFSLLFAQTARSQYFGEFFEEQNNFYDSLPIIIDTNSTLWQIGVPQKSLFIQAYTAPNVLVTDTINPYPVNDTARFWIHIDLTDDDLFGYYSDGIAALKWAQQIDMDSLDGGMIEFSINGGQTWENAFDSPYAYNYYGWAQENVGMLTDGSLAFVGTDSLWREIWLCFEMGFLIEGNTAIDVRYTFISDSINGGGEGWMIDNVLLEPTYVHTVAEKESEETLTVYPNPSNSRIYIKAKRTPEQPFIKSIELITLQGKVIKKFGLSPTKFFIDVDDIMPGTYLINITLGDRTEMHRVVIE